eukprot:2281870-Ditylum_brightwellii.AAC.1
MKKEEDPTRLFEKLSGLQNWFNTATFQIATGDIIAAILEKAPTMYSAVLTCKQRNKGTALE